MSRTAAIVFLGVLFLLAGKIGSSLGQALTIFTIFVWMTAAGLLIYLVLYRGVKFDPFGSLVRGVKHPDTLFIEAEAENEHEDEAQTTAEVVPLRRD